MTMRTVWYQYLLFVKLHWANFIFRDLTFFLKFLDMVFPYHHNAHILSHNAQVGKYNQTHRLNMAPSSTGFAGIICLTLDWRYESSAWKELVNGATSNTSLENAAFQCLSLRLRELNLVGLSSAEGALDVIGLFSRWFENSAHLMKVRMVIDYKWKLVSHLHWEELPFFLNKNPRKA